MTGSENTRWVAVSALGAAMFAIGFFVCCGGLQYARRECQRGGARGGERERGAAAGVELGLGGERGEWCGFRSHR